MLPNLININPHIGNFSRYSSSVSNSSLTSTVFCIKSLVNVANFLLTTGLLNFKAMESELYSPFLFFLSTPNFNLVFFHHYNIYSYRNKGYLHICYLQILDSLIFSACGKKKERVRMQEI